MSGSKLGAIFLVGIVGISVAQASPFTPGNLLASKGSFMPDPNMIFEYTRSGNLVQSLTVPMVNDGNGNDTRGITVDHLGNLHVFAGSTAHYAMYNYNAISGAWTSTSMPGFGIYNLGDSGTIASYKDYVFIPKNGPNPAGLIRYNTVTEAYETFGAPDEDPMDISMGADGLLYVLKSWPMPGSLSIRVYDPNTLALQRTIPLTSLTNQDIRQFQVRPDGKIWLSDFGKPLYLVDTNGALISTTILDHPVQISDFALAADGAMAFTNIVSNLTIFDSNLAVTASFNYTTNNTYSALTFVPSPVPEPSTVALMVAGVGILALRRRRR